MIIGSLQSTTDARKDENFVNEGGDSHRMFLGVQWSIDDYNTKQMVTYW